MKNQKLISVIIPVYNTSKYLKKCLNSVVNQTLKDIEIILVNDGSTDNSLAICQQFAKNDHRIILINKQNEGLEKARITGVQNSSGLYLTHVDSDDWLELNGLEVLYKAALKSNACITSGNCLRVMDKFGFIKRANKGAFMLESKLIDHKEFMDAYYKNFFGVNIFPVAMWGRLYKKSFIESVIIQGLGFNMGEDLNYNIQVFPEAKGMCFITEVVYLYRYGGMTTKFNDKFMFSVIKMFDLKKQMISKYELPQLTDYIIYELKNYLKSYIEMMIIFKPFSKEQACIEIEKLLNHSYYKEVIRFFNENNNAKESFVLSMIGGNSKALYLEMEQKVKKEKYVRSLKRIASKLLN